MAGMVWDPVRALNLSDGKHGMLICLAANSRMERQMCYWTTERDFLQIKLKPLLRVVAQSQPDKITSKQIDTILRVCVCKYHQDSASVLLVRRELRYKIERAQSKCAKQRSFSTERFYREKSSTSTSHKTNAIYELPGSVPPIPLTPLIVSLARLDNEDFIIGLGKLMTNLITIAHASSTARSTPLLAPAINGVKKLIGSLDSHASTLQQINKEKAVLEHQLSEANRQLVKHETNLNRIGSWQRDFAALQSTFEQQKIVFEEAQKTERANRRASEQLKRQAQAQQQKDVVLIKKLLTQQSEDAALIKDLRTQLHGARSAAKRLGGNQFKPAVLRPQVIDTKVAAPVELPTPPPSAGLTPTYSYKPYQVPKTPEATSTSNPRKLIKSHSYHNLAPESVKLPDLSPPPPLPSILASASASAPCTPAKDEFDKSNNQAKPTTGRARHQSYNTWSPASSRTRLEINTQSVNLSLSSLSSSTLSAATWTPLPWMQRQSRSSPSSMPKKSPLSSVFSPKSIRPATSTSCSSGSIASQSPAEISTASAGIVDNTPALPPLPPDFDVNMKPVRHGRGHDTYLD